jgi:hypothetical protein
LSGSADEGQTTSSKKRQCRCGATQTVTLQHKLKEIKPTIEGPKNLPVSAPRCAGAVALGSASWRRSLDLLRVESDRLFAMIENYPAQETAAA